MEYPLPKVFDIIIDVTHTWSIIIIVVTIILILIARFVIKDESGSPILKIEGPLCPCSCCGDVDFNVRKGFSHPPIKNFCQRGAQNLHSPSPTTHQFESNSPGVQKWTLSKLKVVTMDGQEVGKITKQWSGMLRCPVNLFLFKVGKV